jgi:hypothetical protein
MKINMKEKFTQKSFKVKSGIDSQYFTINKSNQLKILLKILNFLI